MDLNLDFTGVERPSYKPLPEGTYELKLVGFKIKPGKSEPDNQVAHLVYEVTDSAEHEHEYDGKKVFSVQVLDGPGANSEYIKIWLEALTNQEMDGSFSLDPDGSQLLDLECTAFVGIVPDFRDNDKEQNAIKYYIPKF